VLFNSAPFIFLFLPIAWAGFFAVAARFGQRAALAWLISASLFFYGWWNPRYLALIALSVAVNFAVGKSLARLARGPARPRRAVLTLGVAFNLGLLGWFKYANFFADTLSAVTGSDFHLQRIILPLAISFFTFQQIAFIVDASRGKTGPYGFLEYGFLVTFFPHLIAGPIVQHGDLLSQVKPEAFRPSSRNVALGLSLFFAGLFKKVVVADRLAPLAGAVYDAASTGATGAGFTTSAAWIATIAYSFQLYFDFSGYSDMAIGLARTFNFTFPQNFDSPYKANNAIDFWRRWHTSLSRFLRDYLYFSLGGNREGKARRHVNLMITMLLGGLWHGAGWGFVTWGGLNGLYLVVNHLWHDLRGITEKVPKRGWLAAEAAGLATFGLIMLSRVFFRSATFGRAGEVLGALLGASAAGPGSLAGEGPVLVAFAALWVVVRALPNTQEILADHAPVTRPLQGVAWLRFTFSHRWALGVAAAALMSLLSLQQVSQFLYFQF